MDTENAWLRELEASAFLNRFNLDELIHHVTKCFAKNEHFRHWWARMRFTITTRQQFQGEFLLATDALIDRRRLYNVLMNRRQPLKEDFATFASE